MLTIQAHLVGCQPADSYEFGEHSEGNIKLIAVIEARDSLTGPGIMLKLNLPQEPEFVRWSLSDPSGLYPSSFRESHTAFFYLPTTGTFQIVANWYYGPFLQEAEALQLVVSNQHLLITHNPGLSMETSQIVRAENFQSPGSVWQELELLGSRTKPFTVAGVPWYVPAGIVAAGGAAVMIVSGSDDEPSPTDTLPSLKANDLTISFECPNGIDVYPLSNDQGQNLIISEVTGLSSEIGRFIPPERVEIFPGLSESIAFKYTARDELGNTASASVNVDVSLPDFELRDLELTITAGESASGDVFENDECTACELISAGEAVSGSVQFENGRFNYQSEEAFGGWIEIPYEAKDACGQMGSAILKIEVEPVCKAEFTVVITAEDCGLKNGSIDIQKEQEGDFSINWEDGSGGFFRDELPEGLYSLTITEESNQCTYEKELEVSSLEIDYFNQFNTLTGNCLESPDAQFRFNNPGAGPLILQLDGPTGFRELEISNWEAETSLTELWPEDFFSEGSYLLKVFDLSAGEECSGEVNFELAEEPLRLETTDDELVLRQGQEKSINLLENDSGYGLILKDIEGPLFGDLSFESDGTATYLAPADEFGNFSLIYEVSDSCDQTASGILYIEVLECEWTAEFEITMANCGTADGSINVLLENETAFTFEWSVPGDSSQLKNLEGSTYFLTITEVATNCREEFELEVGIAGPEAVNDTFRLSAIDTLQENILQNDIGYGLKLTFFEPVSEGFLEIEDDGQMSFSALGEFTGMLEFSYVITDSCGGTDTGMVFIEVFPLLCEADWDLAIDSADCGLSNATVIFRIETECEYELIWHDSSSADTLLNQEPGEYELTLILSGDAFEPDTITIPYTVEQKKPSYIVSVSKEDGSCIESGKIFLELESSGDGVFEIEIEGPDGRHTFESSETFVEISEELFLSAGFYIIIVSDISLDCPLSDSIEVTLEEQPLPLQVNDLILEVFSGETIPFNVLENSEGEGLKVSGHDFPPFGSLLLDENGQGSFSSEIPENGTIEIKFFVQDSCGQLDTGMLTIIVELPPCDFEVTFEITEADCGFSTGAIQATVNKSGDYLFHWSNGESGNELSDVAAGTYALTVEDVLLQCELEFATEMTEKPANWILDYEVIPSGCDEDGGVKLDLQTPVGNQLQVKVSGPGISASTITVSEGMTDLRNFFVFQFGLYTIEVNPVGSTCKEIIQVEIDLISDPSSLLLLEAVPPVNFQQSNGYITIELINTVFPATVYVNGEEQGIATESPYQIQGLTYNIYEIQLVDARNCSSDLLEVELSPEGGQSSMVVVNHFNSTGHFWSLTDQRQILEQPGLPPAQDIKSILYPGPSSAIIFKYRPLRASRLSVGMQAALNFQSGLELISTSSAQLARDWLFGQFSAGPYGQLNFNRANLSLSAGKGISHINVRPINSPIHSYSNATTKIFAGSTEIELKGEYKISQSADFFAGFRYTIYDEGLPATFEYRVGFSWEF